MDEKVNLGGMHAGASPVVFQRAQRLRQNMTVTERTLWEYLILKPFKESS
jgi:very-short-patch-repair endonuclease